MATFPAKTSYNNGDIYYNTDVNDFGDLINKLYGNGGVSASSGLVTAKGDVLTGSAASTLVKTAIGSNNTVMYANSAATGGVSWGLITSAMITDGTIVAADIANATITGAKLVNATITSTQVDGATVYIRGDVSGFSPTSSKIHIRSTAPTSPAAGDIWFQI